MIYKYRTALHIKGEGSCVCIVNILFGVSSQKILVDNIEVYREDDSYPAVFPNDLEMISYMGLIEFGDRLAASLTFLHLHETKSKQTEITLQ